jgi:hypothetical protein
MQLVRLRNGVRDDANCDAFPAAAAAVDTLAQAGWSNHQLMTASMFRVTNLTPPVGTFHHVILQSKTRFN